MPRLIGRDRQCLADALLAFRLGGGSAE